MGKVERLNSEAELTMLEGLNTRVYRHFRLPPQAPIIFIRNISCHRRNAVSHKPSASEFKSPFMRRKSASPWRLNRVAPHLPRNPLLRQSSPIADTGPNRVGQWSLGTIHDSRFRAVHGHFPPSNQHPANIGHSVLANNRNPSS